MTHQYKIDHRCTADVRFVYAILCEENKNVPVGVEVTAVADLGKNDGLAYQRTRQILMSASVWKQELGKRWIKTLGWVAAPPKIGYVIYVLCHELAHIRRADNGDFHTDHGKAFQEDLKLICPPELQHYEYEYMPDYAIMADVEHRVDFTS